MNWQHAFAARRVSAPYPEASESTKPVPKKIKFESFRYQLLFAASQRAFTSDSPAAPSWSQFLRQLRFRHAPRAVVLSWGAPAAGEMTFATDQAHLHVRSDISLGVDQHSAGIGAASDPVSAANQQFFSEAVERLAIAAGYQTPENVTVSNRHKTERAFHDEWASSTNPASIDVRAVNEACTAPEMRFITKKLGRLNGKKLLDVGCGLGEASVYFALQGAVVTSSDLSPEMLAATADLANLNGVKVSPHLSAAEDLRLPLDARFDVIYAGNLLHHVDIEATLVRLKPYLASDGVLVTWDPLAYNPVINVYRRLATDVRTSDEHPLTWSDLQCFRRHFGQVEPRYFWLVTLIIFIVMALVQRRNPNKERFWKAVVTEEKRWRWIYRPLERLDRLLLTVVPPLRLLCWNVVIFARR